MTELPRLELFQQENKNNEYIIFRNQIKMKKTRKTDTKKQRHKKSTKKIKTRRRKGIFNLF